MRVRIAQLRAANIEVPARFSTKFGAATRRRDQRLIRWGRDIFLVCGALLLGYAGFTMLEAKLYQASEARQFRQQVSDAHLANAAGDGTSAVRVAALRGGALGEIEIARLGVTAMIMEGIDERTLRHAVGHVPGTPLPGSQGNVAIAGHRDTFFRALRNIRQGDEITLMTLDGSYRYLVDTTQVVRPQDTQVLDNSNDSVLTLVTCYPFYFVGPSPKRFIVHAHKVLG